LTFLSENGGKKGRHLQKCYAILTIIRKSHFE
jgi:hypothetical protein